MQMNVYDLRRLIAIARLHGFTDVSAHIEETVADTNVICESICLYAKR